MDKKITAEWARKTSKDILGEKVLAQILKCESAIKNSVKQNKDKVNVSIYAEDLTLEELRSRGFKINKHQAHDQRESDYITISW